MVSKSNADDEDFRDLHGLLLFYFLSPDKSGQVAVIRCICVLNIVKGLCFGCVKCDLLL